MGPTAVPEEQEQTQKDIKKVSAAIYYHPDGFDTSKPKLMGRQAAGESFLKAYARYGEADVYYCYTQTKGHYEHFKQQIQGIRDLQASWIPTLDHPRLAEPGCLFLPGPGLSQHAWLRRYGNPKAYSLCGITHTTASDRVMDAVGELLTAPVQPWDAVICTSQSAKTMVEKLLHWQHEYLCERLGAPIPASFVQLPVIPLGVDCHAFTANEKTQVARQKWREQLTIRNEDVVVLFVGRLAFHAKAHPLPLYLALEQAAQQTGKKLHLLMSGWFANKTIQKEFTEGARLYCPSVNVVFVEGRHPEVRSTIWYAADIFTSLSDNIQETFGITPVEAMAAGLPAVVTDWDGYRESVVHGVTGFTVPTLMPEPGHGQDLALRYAMSIDNYDQYVGQVSQTTAVDVATTTNAFVTLITDPALRQKMGEAGRQHALKHFDWPVVITQYQNLWRQLAEIRQDASVIAPRKSDQPVHPLRHDPYHVFSHYATRPIHTNTLITLTDGVSAETFGQRVSLAMNRMLQPELSSAQCQQVLAFIQQQGRCRVSDIQSQPFIKDKSIAKTIAWLAKLGLIQV